MSITFKEFYNLDTDKATSIVEIFGKYQKVKPGDNVADHPSRHPNRHALAMLQDDKEGVIEKIRKLEADADTPKNDPYLTMLRNKLSQIEAKIKEKSRT